MPLARALVYAIDSHLNIRQLAILDQLVRWEQQGRTGVRTTELRAELQDTSRNVSGALGGLEDLGLVHRKLFKKEKRNEIYVTDRGRTTMGWIRELTP